MLDRYILRGLSSKLDGRLLASPVESAFFWTESLTLRPSTIASARWCTIDAPVDHVSDRGSKIPYGFRRRGRRRGRTGLGRCGVTRIRSILSASRPWRCLSCRSGPVQPTHHLVAALAA
jgi:hypothetical protein